MGCVAAFLKGRERGRAWRPALWTLVPVQVVASSPAETQTHILGCSGCVHGWVREGRAEADGSFIYRPTRSSSSFPQLEVKRGGQVLYEVTRLGGSLTSKVTAQGNLSQLLILPEGLGKQHLVVIYAK